MTDVFRTPAEIWSSKVHRTLHYVVFLKVDVDDCEDIAAEHKITAMPTFIFLRKGIQVAVLQGANVEKLKELVNTHKAPMNIQGEEF